MKEEKRLVHKVARADSYKVLSDCYYMPGEQLIQRLTDIDESVCALCLGIEKYIPDPDELEGLGIDFSKLFVGPFKLLVPPYGSVYMENDRTLMGTSTVDVRQRYQEEGLALALKEVPDHIAIELEFMYFLIYKEIEAQNSSDIEMVERYRGKELSFLKEHLGAWVSEFSEKVEEHAETPFYKNLARVTRSFVHNDLDNLFSR